MHNLLSASHSTAPSSTLSTLPAVQVVFIDELDALAPARGGGPGGGTGSGSGGSSARVVATLLTEMDALGGELWVLD